MAVLEKGLVLRRLSEIRRKEHLCYCGKCKEFFINDMQVYQNQCPNVSCYSSMNIQAGQSDEDFIKECRG